MSKKSIIFLILVALLFAAINFWLITPVPTQTSVGDRFDSPDETADFFWAKNFAQTGQLKIAEPLNSVAKNQLHPRSFNVTNDGSLVPGVFLGLIAIYGGLAKIFSSAIIIYLTPIFAFFGVLAFYGICKKIFGQKVALVAAIMLIINPVWWYYSVISMYPNVTFISLTLVGVYLFLAADKKPYLFLALGGVAISLALAIRPAEAVWLVFATAVAVLVRRKKFNFFQAAVPFFILAITVFLMLWVNQQLYGNWSASGYSQLQAAPSTTCQFCQVTASLFLPFGFHPWLALNNFWRYYVSLFWWLTAFAGLGIIIFLAKLKKAALAQIIYFAASALIGIFLSLYYGSMVYFDVIIQQLNSIGLSYVRYWLPLYIVVIPFAALAVLWLAEKLKKKWQVYAVIFILILLFYQSLNSAVLAGSDSIWQMRSRIASYKEISAQVNSDTPAQSVIVTVRQDKVFFPDRKVIHTFSALNENEELIGILPALVKVAPVYYFSPGAVKNLNISSNLKLQKVKAINDSVLYKLSAAN